MLKKVCPCNNILNNLGGKLRRVSLKYVGHFVAKAVFDESANQFSFEEMCRTQCSLKYRSHIEAISSIRPSGKILNLKMLRSCMSIKLLYERTFKYDQVHIEITNKTHFLKILQILKCLYIFNFKIAADHSKSVYENNENSQVMLQNPRELVIVIVRFVPIAVKLILS